MTEEKGAAMQVQTPTIKYELNLNTVIILVGFIAMLGGWFYNTGQFVKSVEETDAKHSTWEKNHEQLHTERQSENSASTARTDQRLGTLEGEMRRVDNIEYRLTIQEQGAANLGRTVEEVKTIVNSQSTDIKVMREILGRLDPRTAD